MATSATMSRYIRRTTTGYFIERPTRISAICVTPAGGDVHVDFYDGGAGGQVIWSMEADAGAGSTTINFNPPLNFTTKIYATIEDADPANNGSVQIAVVEPALHV
jgi:hypothetical protein